MAGATNGAESITINAAPGRVYELVSDVKRMGEWSPECFRCEWLEGATRPEIGACFRGDNRAGPYRWSTIATVTAADPGREFAFVTRVRDRESTEWCYRFEASADGTHVTESYKFLWAPLHIRIFDVFVRRDRQLANAMRKTLERIKAAAQ